jgi:hypothetical protein
MLFGGGARPADDVVTHDRNNKRYRNSRSSSILGPFSFGSSVIVAVLLFGLVVALVDPFRGVEGFHIPQTTTRGVQPTARGFGACPHYSKANALGSTQKQQRGNGVVAGLLRAAASSGTEASNESSATSGSNAESATTTATFDVDTALFCAGLAFDTYVEPDPDSSRWERGVSVVLCCVVLCNSCLALHSDAMRFCSVVAAFFFLLPGNWSCPINQPDRFIVACLVAFF